MKYYPNQTHHRFLGKFRARQYRDHYQKEQSKLLWKEPTKEEPNISIIASDAA